MTLNGKNGKRYENKEFRLTIRGGQWWVKWLRNGVGEGFISPVIILVHCTFQRNILYFSLLESQLLYNKKIKELLDFSMKFNYVITKQSPKMLRAQGQVKFIKSFDQYPTSLIWITFFSSPDKLQNEISEIFKMIKNNMKFTRPVC